MSVAISITLSGFGRLFGEHLAAVVDVARAAEEAGLDQLVLPEHVVMGPRRDRYPYGRFPYPIDEPWPEPFTTLAAMAAVTNTIRLSTGVVIAPLRPPAVLAKEAATLDVLANGRLDLGVGLGWQAEEFDAAGLSFEDRGRRFDDTLRACRTLWSGAAVDFASPTVSFRGIVCRPTPVQSGGIPLWIAGGPTPATARRIAELGAGWLPMVGTPIGDIERGIEQIARACALRSRDVGEIGIRAGARLFTTDTGALDVERTVAHLQDLGSRGVTIASFGVGRSVRELADLATFLRALGDVGRAGQSDASA